jgi:hypothetical protein
MSSQDPAKVTAAASAVMQALEPLTPEERARVLNSAAALFDVIIQAAKPMQGGTMRAAVVVASNENEGATPVRPKKKLSLVEFLNEKQPATNGQRLACFAFYREHIEGNGSTFGKDSLESYFATAKLPAPGNYDRDYRETAAKGWIHDAGNESYLTQAGEKAVTAGFLGKAAPRGASTVKRKNSAASESQ